jgi:hypothetical protein
MFELLVLMGAVSLLVGLTMAVNWMESQELRFDGRQSQNATLNDPILQEQDADEAKAG